GWRTVHCVLRPRYIPREFEAVHLWKPDRGRWWVRPGSAALHRKRTHRPASTSSASPLRVLSLSWWEQYGTSAASRQTVPTSSWDRKRRWISLLVLPANH